MTDKNFYLIALVICLIGMAAVAAIIVLGDDGGGTEGDDSGDLQAGEPIGMSNGTSVTVFEQSGDVLMYTITIEQLGGQGYELVTTWGHEIYLFTTDGDNFIILCYRDAYSEGRAVGNNIVAVRLNGVPGYDNGIWASDIVNYSLGYNGIEESLENALGPDSKIGPYEDSLCTYAGDQYSLITLAFRIPSE
jgi:hypothetical protein